MKDGGQGSVTDVNDSIEISRQLLLNPHSKRCMSVVSRPSAPETLRSPQAENKGPTAISSVKVPVTIKTL